MNDKQLIANTLLEIAKNSTTEIIEDAKIDKEIIDAAKKMGLVIPSPDFAIFKTKWADIDKANLNNVRLPRKAVEDGIQTLVGKNLNFEHKGAYNLCGFCLSVKIKDEEIECIQVFYKSLYPDEFEELKEKIKTKEAAVSFEIWNVDPETKKSVVKELKDGTKEITKIHCHGTGLLLINPPACPTAKIFKLVAKQLTDITEKFSTNVFEDNLVYASLATEEPKCINCGNCNCKNNEKEDKVMDEVKKELIQLPEETKTEAKAEETKTDAPTTEKVEEQVAETKSEEAKVEETKEETKVEEPKVEAEAKSEETPKEEEKPEEKKEEIAEEKTEGAETEVKKEEAQPLEQIEPKIIVKVTRIYSEIAIDTYVDGTPSGTSALKGYNKKITEYKDGTKDEVEEEVEVMKKYDFAEAEAKNKEIADLKTVNEELDKEIKKLQKELDNKNQEIANLTIKEEPKEEKELTVGSVEAESESEIDKRAKAINTIIANKNK